MEQVDIRSLSYPELEGLVTGMGQPRFRASQLFGWLHEKQIASYDEAGNLPGAFIRQLQETAPLTVLRIRRKLVSREDGTVKYLYELPDGEFVETVLMRYHHGLSACVSTQVGCRMGCSFCASTKAGFVRQLAPSEMLEQIYASQRDSGERISSVVLMGIGEPLDNYDNVVRFLDILSDERGDRLSLRHVSLSTCGLVDRIRRLQELRLGLTLSVSLHAPNDAIRQQTMPVARKWPMDVLLQACREYAEATGRRISFEYALIAGLNDTMECADELAARLRGQGGTGWCHVNLIPVNEIRETEYRRSDKLRVESFQKRLLARGINATVRRTLGRDINAACGQLRRDEDRSQTSQKEGSLF